jgi:endo-1,3-1,4-beta-glycanase ExoK
MRTLKLELLLVCLAVGGFGAGAAGQDQGTGAAEAFVDRFATFNNERWLVSDGWSNGAHQACTWSKKSVKTGKNGIALSVTNEPKGERRFSCGEIQSKALYGYGTYEARMRPAAGEGIVTGFFTYVGPPIKKDAPHDEIDFEFLGKAKDNVDLNFYVKGDKDNYGRTVSLGFDATAAMNDYAFEWLPDSVRWFVNGRLIYEKSGKPGESLPRHPGKIFLSLWAGAGGEDTIWWLGKFTYPGKPMVANVEYVAFTPMGAPCQFPKSIVCARSGKSSAAK